MVVDEDDDDHDDDDDDDDDNEEEEKEENLETVDESFHCPTGSVVISALPYLEFLKTHR